MFAFVLGCAVVLPPAFGGGDHHMHIQSADAVNVWYAMCDAMPDDCGDDEVLTTSGSHAIAVLDVASLEKGAILSLAYFYGVPELAGSEFDDHRLVHNENAYVAAEVRRFPDRLKGFFSVNPLAEYALGEVRYWAGRDDLAGLKLHLANSGFDFDDADHVAKLRAIIDVMNEHSLPVVIHLRNRDPNYGYDHAALFIDRVARHAPNVVFQLAHAAGWGGYDEGTDGAIQAFLDAIARGDLERDNIWFDVAAVVSDDVQDADLARFQKRLREIGLDRVLFASDWDEAAPATYILEMGSRLSLDDEEWARLLDNEAPFFR